MTLPENAVREQLHRILDSETFRHAARLRAFLRFVVEEKLAGRQEQIKEYSIGRDVCGRPESFNPKIDPIVRVDANRLRSRLETYYQGEGSGVRVVIELPKGAYVPVFTERSPLNVSESSPSLAVLPFVNLGPSADHDYLADSLTEELIHLLARVRGLRVIARTSVFQFKNRPMDTRQVGRQLGVRYVLEGSVRAAGTRLRITARLIDSQLGSLLWSEKYERGWDDVLAMQDEVSASIADALQLQLVLPHATGDPEAYADYLRGRYYWNQRTPEALAASVRCYEQALQRDAASAPAHAGLADTLTVMAMNDQEPSLAVIPRARAAVKQALELRPGWPVALTSRGFIRSVFDWDWEGAALDFEQAIESQSGYSNSYYLYGVVNLLPRRRWAEALRCLRTALLLDPVSPVLLRDLGLAHFMMGEWDEAETHWRQAESLAPTFRGCLYWRARLLIESGRIEDALTALNQRLACGSANTRVLATIAYAHARAGAASPAHEILDRLHALALTSRVPALDFAVVWLGLGELDRALPYLEQARESKAAALYQFGIDPMFEPVRAHLQGKALLRAMNLATS